MLNITDPIDIATRTVDGEARGEGAEGQIAVFWVIKNRVLHPSWWGTDVVSVCLHPEQFSCWNHDDVNSVRLKLLPITDSGYQSIRYLAGRVLGGSIPDPTSGATHYKVTGTVASWDKAAVHKMPVIIGHHSFYNLGPHA